MKRAFSTAALFIGTTIGAGFATGREIALFFGVSSPLSAALAGVFMAAVGSLFLVAGKRKLLPTDSLWLDGAILFAALATSAAMIGGAESILHSMTGLPLLGLATLLVCIFTVAKGMHGVELLNTVAVPAIIVLIGALFFKNGIYSANGDVSVWAAVKYAGLNMFLGGLTSAKRGDNFSKKEIAFYFVLVALSMSFMLYMLQSIVKTDINGSLMPVYAIASVLNMPFAAGVLIVAAIITTLASSLELARDCVSHVLRRIKRLAHWGEPQNTTYTVMALAVLSYLISFAGFGDIVDFAYPIISLEGILLAAYCAAKLAFSRLDFPRPNLRLRPRRHRRHLYGTDW